MLGKLKNTAKAIFRQKPVVSLPPSSFNLKLISERQDASDVVDVIFVHGLGGHITDTWTSDGFWPNWLAEAEPKLQIWALGWNAQKLSWIGKGTMPIQEHSLGVLDRLHAEGIGKRKIAFCCHSLGGVLIKNVLRVADGNPTVGYSDIANQTKAILFYGTPHTGSVLARVAQALGGSVLVQQLTSDDPHLLELNRWFSAGAHRLGIAVKSFYETQSHKFFGLIVGRSSADAHVLGGAAVPVDADHINICKPTTKSAPVYVSTLQTLRSVVQLNSVVKRYPVKVEVFLESYLGREGKPKPFSGRTSAVDELSAWLGDASRSQKMLVCGPAGRGKSALLANWTASLRRSEAHAWNVVFVPVSIRFNTNRPTVFYRIWLTQLLAISGKQFPSTPQDDLEDFLASEVLEEMRSVSENTVVVVDGLDEAVALRFDETLFVSSLPENVKLLVSARFQDDDTDSTGWLKRLGWTRADSIEKLELEALKLSDVRDVVNACYPNKDIQEPVIDELFRLSEGEPFILSLYLEEIESKVGHQRVLADQLKLLSPGFAPYFKRWLEGQRASIKDAGGMFDQQQVDATLAILACAEGPLTGEQIVDLVERITDVPRPVSTAAFIEPINRFVIGSATTGGGYVLCHPKFGHFLKEDYILNASIKQSERALMAWCANTLGQLNGGSLNSSQVPPYLIQFYLVHLQKLEQPWRDYLPLLSRALRDAIENMEGASNGFASIVKSVLERLKREQEAAKFPEVVANQIFAALCLSSMSSVGKNLNGQMLRLALDEQALTTQQAIKIIDSRPIESRAEDLRSIFNYLDKETKREAIEPLLREPNDSRQIENRAQSLVRMFSQYPCVRAELFQPCLDAVEQCESNYRKSVLLCELAENADELRDNLLVDAETHARAAEAKFRANAFGFLYRAQKNVGSDGKKTDSTMNEFLQLLDSEDKESSKVNMLLNFSAVLPSEELISRLLPVLPRYKRAFEEALVKWHSGAGYNEEYIGLDIRIACERYIKIMLVCNVWSEDEIADKVTAIAGTIGDDYTATQVLKSTLKLLGEAAREEIALKCFDRAKLLQAGNNVSHAMLELSNVPSSIRTMAARECIKNARLICDKKGNVDCLIKLFSCLSIENQQLSLQRLRDAIRSIERNLDRGRLLIHFENAAHIEVRSEDGSSLIETGLELINSSWGPSFRASEFIVSMDLIPEKHKAQAFRFAQDAISKSDQFVAVNLSLLADKAPDLFDERTLMHSLEVAEREGGYGKAMLISSLASVYGRLGKQSLLEDAIDFISSVEDVKLQLRSLAKVLPFLDEDRSQTLADSYCDHLDEIIAEAAGDFSGLVEFMSTAHKNAAKERILSFAISEIDRGNWELLDKILPLLSEDQREESVKRLCNFALTLPGAKLVVLSGKLLDLVASDRKFRLIQQLFDGSISDRSSCFQAIGNTAPALHEIGGDELILEVMSKVDEASSWWP